MRILCVYSYEETKKEGDVEEPRPCSADRAIAEVLSSAGNEVNLVKFDEKALARLKDDYDLICNQCDGFNDESLNELKVIKFFEKLEMPFTGCSSSCVANSTEKSVAKELLKEASINTPRFQAFKNPEQQLSKELSFPLIVKPIAMDASEGIEEDSVVFDEQQLKKKILQVNAEFKMPALVEEYIEGREFCVPIIGNEKPEVLKILEIDYSEHFEGKPKILSYKAKWSKNSNAFKNTYSIIARLDEKLARKIEAVALSAFKALECNGYATVDIRVDSEGRGFVLEVNPNAYIAPESDIVKAAKASGLEYNDLLDKICVLGLERFGRKLLPPLAVRTS